MALSIETKQVDGQWFYRIGSTENWTAYEKSDRVLTDEEWENERNILMKKCRRMDFVSGIVIKALSALSDRILRVQ